MARPQSWRCANHCETVQIIVKHSNPTLRAQSAKGGGIAKQKVPAFSGGLQMLKPIFGPAQDRPYIQRRFAIGEAKVRALHESIVKQSFPTRREGLHMVEKPELGLAMLRKTVAKHK